MYGRKRKHASRSRGRIKRRRSGGVALLVGGRPRRWGRVGRWPSLRGAFSSPFVHGSGSITEQTTGFTARPSFGSIRSRSLRKPFKFPGGYRQPFSTYAERPFGFHNVRRHGPTARWNLRYPGRARVSSYWRSYGRPVWKFVKPYVRDAWNRVGRNLVASNLPPWAAGVLREQLRW